MAKKIQKKQIEDGVFVETKSTYSAPTQDNEFVQKKYVDEEVAKKADVSHTHSWVDITNKPRISVTLADTAISRTYTIGLTGANGSSGKLIIPKAVSWNDVTDKPAFPTLPSWVTQTKPTYDWTEIQNKPEIDKKVRYERVSDLNTLLTEKGILKVADGDNVEGAPVKGSNVWWHFIAGSHLNSLDWQYYLAFPLAIESSDFWFKQKLATQDKSWVKFSGLRQLNGNGLFREWNLEHGLSAYIGNSNVFNVRTGVSGGTSDLLFGVQNDKVVVPTYLESANELKGSELWLDTDKNGNVTRFRANGDTLTIGNKEWNDLKYLHTKGIKIWGHTNNNEVVLAGGEAKGLGVGQKQTIDLKGLNENKYYLVYCDVATTDRVKVRVQNALNWTSKPSWSTHDGGFSLNLEFEQTGAGWGSNHQDLNITQYAVFWSNAEPVMNIGQMGNSSTMFMYLRGGGEYYIYNWSQIGDSKKWINPRKDNGEYTTSSQSIPYSMDWNENLKVAATNIRSYKDNTYGVITKIDKPLVTNEIFLDNNSNSKSNIWTDDNELNVGSRNRGGYTFIKCEGYKVRGKDSNHLLTADGNSITKSELLALPRGYDTSTSVVLPATTVNDTVFVKASITLGLENIPNKGSVSFLKTFDGGSVTFICAGKNIIYTGDNSFNGKDGSTATVTIFENKCYIRIANV